MSGEYKITAAAQKRAIGNQPRVSGEYQRSQHAIEGIRWNQPRVSGEYLDLLLSQSVIFGINPA